MNHCDLHAAYTAIRIEAVRLAGELTDLAQRATVYHHLYRDSGGNHTFPLIAAHGALWARGYFRFGLRLARWVAWQYGWNGPKRQTQLEAIGAFADAFRDINRRVCVDSYTNYHFVSRFGARSGAEEFMSPPLFDALQRLCEARDRGQSLSDAERLTIFEAHFLHEQEQEVGPSVVRAGGALHWPAMKWLALQPIVRFAYFPRWQVIRFRDFANVEERIRNGLQAFAWGSQVGWGVVEDRLRSYQILPAEFFVEGLEFFCRLRDATGAGYPEVMPTPPAR